MAPILKKLFLVIAAGAILADASPAVAGNPIGDFFKNVGRTISQWRKEPTPPPRPARKSKKPRDEEAKPKAEEDTHTLAKLATPTPTPIEVRPAALAPRSRQPRDVPYAVSVPNKPGFVTSPYAPDQGLVDVRAFPSSTEVLDPFTGKIFRTP